MKAYFLTKFGDSKRAFEMRESPIPLPGENEVVIKSECFGLNFADVVARRGFYQDCPKLPCIIGYDVAGYVHQIGSQVSNFKIGDRVVALTRFGGYAEYAATMKEAVTKIPDELSFADSTVLATQATTAYYCAFQTMRLHPGDKVLIQAAAGGVGTVLVQMAKAQGCFVYGTASKSKMEYLRQIGVDVPIDYSSEDFYKVIKDHSQFGDGIDAAFDSLGGKAFKKAFKLLTPGGKIAFIGSASSFKNGNSNIFQLLNMVLGFGIFSPIALILSSKSICGVNMLRIADFHRSTYAFCLSEVVKLYKEGVIKPIVGRQFDHSMLAEAHEFLEKRQSTGKVVMNW